MGDVYALVMFAGIVLIVIGAITYKFPDLLWKVSLERRWFLKGGEPTEFYYTSRRLSGICYVVFGVIMILWSIGTNMNERKGYVIELEGNSFRIPCMYSDVEALGYQIDSSEEIKIITATSKNVKNSSTYTVKNPEGKEFDITFENRGAEDLPATECDLIAVRVEDEIGPVIKLPNGVKTGMKESEIKSIMGRGTVRGVGGSAVEYRPRVSLNTYKVNIVFGGEILNRKATSIRVEDSLF